MDYLELHNIKSSIGLDGIPKEIGILSLSCAADNGNLQNFIHTLVNKSKIYNLHSLTVDQYSKDDNVSFDGLPTYVNFLNLKVTNIVDPNNLVNVALRHFDMVVCKLSIKSKDGERVAINAEMVCLIFDKCICYNNVVISKTILSTATAKYVVDVMNAESANGSVPGHCPVTFWLSINNIIKDNLAIGGKSQITDTVDRKTIMNTIKQISQIGEIS